MSIDDDDLNLDNSFDEFEKKKGTSLGDLWRDNPMVKIGVIAGVAVVIFGVTALFGGSDTPAPQSAVAPGADITAAPGTTEAPKAIVEAIQEVNEKAVEQAYNEGGSALPIPIEPPVGVIEAPVEEVEEEDPLQKWRKLQEERLQKEIEQRDMSASQEATEADAQRAEAISKMADSMQQQMSSILEKHGAGQPIASKSLTDPSFLEDLQKKKEEEALKEAGATSDGNNINGNGEGTDINIEGTTIMPAGEIVYAQLLTEANSDTPGPILAEIMSGPLKGKRAIGSFEVQEDSDLLTLNFETVVVDGESIGIEAVALDPKTTLPGLATEVDHRYFKRIVLPAAAAFVEGMSSAISESGIATVTVSSGGDTTTTEDTSQQGDKQEVSAGIAEAGSEIRTILQDMASEAKVMVKIHAGTPIGIFFLQPVIKDKPEEKEEEDPTQFYQDLMMGGAMPQNQQIPLDQFLGSGIQSNPNQ